MGKKEKSLRRFFRKKVVIALLIIFVLTLGSVSIFLFFQNQNSCASKENKNLPLINKKELAKHDGSNGSSLYIGYDCLVYDVTASKDQYYGEGKTYHYLVGKDSTKKLNIFGGSIIKVKYPVVGVIGN